jgi:cytochrome bd ubiquinol oxidase subunit I
MNGARAAWLATIEGARLVTGNGLYRRVFDFWRPIFAVSFGMGVVTGIAGPCDAGRRS